MNQAGNTEAHGTILAILTAIGSILSLFSMGASIPKAGLFIAWAISCGLLYEACKQYEAVINEKNQEISRLKGYK